MHVTFTLWAEGPVITFTSTLFLLTLINMLVRIWHVWTARRLNIPMWQKYLITAGIISSGFLVGLTTFFMCTEPVFHSVLDLSAPARALNQT
ncbi:hypothetical protein QKR09_gp4 [Fiwi virus]|uniref:Uncharacterized protein n=1 Tax=Fiwi virus TaxID=2675848 RepID=A0AAE7T1R3_9MONO|nr:hypothetical protein QKR09_gp4 [Fiwi virus]QOI11492.1 hypothetical protein [Fiwi virus]